MYRMVFFVFIFVVQSAHSMQKLSVKDGGTYQIVISKKEMTRIAMHGDGRINDYRGVEGALEVKADMDAGEVYVLPSEDSRESVSFFVTDHLGNVYTLIATAKDVPSETIILKPNIFSTSTTENREYANSDYVREVKGLIRNMALFQEISGYSYEELDVDVPLWRETEITLVSEYVGNRFIGNLYVIKNISGRKMVMEEREFSGFGDGVKALAIENHELEKEGKTRLFVVRGNNNAGE